MVHGTRRLRQLVGMYLFRFPKIMVDFSFFRENAGVNQIPFRINSGQFNITTGMWLAPYAEVGFEIRTPFRFVCIGGAHCLR